MIDLDELERLLLEANAAADAYRLACLEWEGKPPSDRAATEACRSYREAVLGAAPELIAELRAARAARKMLEDLVELDDTVWTTEDLFNALQRRIRNAENDAARGAEMAVIAHQLATQIAERTKYAWDDHVRRLERSNSFLITAAQAEALGFTSNKLTEGQMAALGIEPMTATETEARGVIPLTYTTIPDMHTGAPVVTAVSPISADPVKGKVPR